MTESSSSFDIKKKEIEHIIRKICSDENATSLTFSESSKEKIRSELIAFGELFMKESAEIAFASARKKTQVVDIKEGHVLQAAHKLEQSIGLPPLSLIKMRRYEKLYKLDM